VILEPGVLLARIQPERKRIAQREGRVLADKIIGGGVAHLDGAVAHRIDSLERRNDFASSKALNLEFIVGGFRHVFRQRLGRAIGGVERFRKA